MGKSCLKMFVEPRSALTKYLERNEQGRAFCWSGRKGVAFGDVDLIGMLSEACIVGKGTVIRRIKVPKLYIGSNIDL